ncbi:MAG TPA: three-Cys-motif partner protein TcmP [bacterium]
MNKPKNKHSWDISEKPSTQTKLGILRQVFDMWLTIWNAPNQYWVKELYVIDLFAGRGIYIDNGRSVYGSPLIFLDVISDKLPKLRKGLKVKIFAVEKDENNFYDLTMNIKKFIKEHPQIVNVINVKCYPEDCNIAIQKILKEIENNTKCPLFVLIDPYGIKIKKTTLEPIIKLENPKDILLNYILEGVRRTVGIAKKEHSGASLNIREIGSLRTLRDFLGDSIDITNGNGTNDYEILEQYVKSLFIPGDLIVVGYDMKYPNRDDILYFLLFASRKVEITDIVKDIYARTKEKQDPTLFGIESQKTNIFTMHPKIQSIERKSLLYKSEVEYGHWTINHIEGCVHGCRFPCYAYMMSKKFGRVTNMNEWRKIKIVGNALILLEKEIKKFYGELDRVHLCFMTDPFMYDKDRNTLIPEIKNLTLKIIEMLNMNNIRVTTLTKGQYPDEMLDEKFLKSNEYGITLVSLNEQFKQNYEPYSAPYGVRIDSIKRLHKKGHKTWVSIEPYPTPNLDSSALKIENLLNEIGFVDKIIFGKINYNVQSTKFKDNDSFYKTISKTIITFCEKHKIKYHIKSGTPYSKRQTEDIFATTNVK